MLADAQRHSGPARRRWWQLMLAALLLWGVGGMFMAGPGAGGLTVLAMGVDGDGDGGRSDTMVLLRMDPRVGQTLAVSLPRDTRVTIPGRPAPEKLNHAHAHGGAELTVATVEQWLGIEIDYWVRLDYAAVIALVDALGGVELDVEHDMYYRDPYQNLLIDLKAGRQVLSGEQALHYLRYRGDAGDLTRIARQQRLLAALIAEVKEQGYWRAGPRLVRAARAHMDSSMGAGSALPLLLHARALRTIDFVTLPGTAGYEDGIWYFFADDTGTRALVEELR